MKTINDLWKEFKKINYGRSIDQISRAQLVESEQVFKFAIGMYGMYLRDEVSNLSEEEGAKVMQDHNEEIKNFIEQRLAESMRG